VKVENNDKHRGAAYRAVKFVYDESPGRSWQRLNGALQQTLSAAIECHLSFEEDDFRAMYSDMNGGYWMGNSVGSVCGESFYSYAVKMGNRAACISFEKYAGRPSALWAEKVKTPERLCIGSEFTWDGLQVKVTNMRSDHLIACSYKDNPEAGSYGKLKQDSINYIDGAYRKVEELKRLDDGSILLRTSPPLKSNHESRIPDRRFKITYKELAAKRKEYDATLKQALKDIRETATPAELQTVSERLNSAGRHAYRHFDIEEMRGAINEQRETFNKREVKRQQELAEAEALARWQAGENGRGFFSTVRLRVSGPYVETSTGHSVTIESVKRSLDWALKHRSRFGPVKNKHIDLHPIKRFTSEGVLIGCTMVPWTEVERLPVLLGMNVQQ
jgi:hypothetical protein